MQRLFDRGMLAMLGLLLALLIANGAVAYRNVQELFEGRLKVEESRRAQAALQRTLSVLQDAETGVRGYVVTGETAYLEPYDVAVAQVDARLEELGQLMREPEQQRLLPEFRVNAENHLLELDAVLAARRQQGFAAARDLMLTGRGKAAMDQLRKVVGRLLQTEALVLERRAQASGQSLAIAQLSTVFGATVAALLIVVLVWQLRRNLTMRDDAAAALRAQEQQFRATLASLGEAVVTCDPAGRVTYVNPTACQLTGWGVARAIGQPIGDIVRVVDPQSHQPLECAAETTLRTGLAVPLAHRGQLLARGGPERPVDDGAEPIRDADGNLVGAVLVFRDITERKKGEDALRDADRRKDEFLAVLAHELRNPLAPLRNALQIVRLAGNDRATHEQVFGMMDRQVRQMVRLIDDLLDVSRITRNKLELRREPVAVADVVEAALEMSAPTVARYGHRVSVRVEAGLPFVDGDRARLVQVLDNLVSNAAKYSEAGSEIEVIARAAEAGRVTLVVKDSGAGIPPEMLERIFEMFTQIDRTLERSRGGLGIGLTLVKRLVELHGGRIVARSEGVGRGSEFEVELPAVQAVAPALLPGGEAEDGAEPPRRIVVCDDNEDAADTLARMLRMRGHEVRVAHDGVECVAECEGFRPEVALVDIGMPRMNGYEAARLIRSQPWGQAVVLVALTGFGQEQDRRCALEAGFDQHLTKPADIARLTRAIQGVRRQDEETHA